MALFSWQKKQKEDGTEQFELPDEIATQLKEGKETKEKLGKVETMLADLINIQKSEKEDREKASREAREAAARVNNSKKQEETDAEIEELMLTNPKEAIRKATENQSAAIMMLRADNIRRELFEDGNKFKYYHGDIKREVDALVAAQTLANRNDPSVVENCYHTIMGKHTDEIAEGKLKHRFAGGESGNRGTSSGSAGSSTTGSGDAKTYDAETMKEIERAAKQTGFKTKDYLEMLEKDGVL